MFNEHTVSSIFSLLCTLLSLMHKIVTGLQTDITHIFPVADGVPYEVVVVAFTSAGRGVENDRSDPFFSVQLSPTVSVNASSVGIRQLNDISINMTWTGLSLIEARGFPEYNATLMLSSTNNRKKRQSSPNILFMLTNNTFAVFNDLINGSSYSAVVGVRSSGAVDQGFNETNPIPGVNMYT